MAVQTLLAREIADTKSRSKYVRAKAVRHLINTSIGIGGIVATGLSLTTYLQKTKVLAGLTSNVAVREAAAGIMPAVLATQVAKGLAYPVNGIVIKGHKVKNGRGASLNVHFKYWYWIWSFGCLHIRWCEDHRGLI